MPVLGVPVEGQKAQTSPLPITSAVWDITRVNCMGREDHERMFEKPYTQATCMRAVMQSFTRGPHAHKVILSIFTMQHAYIFVSSRAGSFSNLRTHG